MADDLIKDGEAPIKDGKKISGDPVSGEEPTPTPIPLSGEIEINDPGQEEESIPSIYEILIKKNTTSEEYFRQSLGGDATDISVSLDEDGHIVIDSSQAYSTMPLSTVFNSLIDMYNNLAPTYHASSQNIYGPASTTEYGHVKIGYGLKIATDGSTCIDYDVVVSPTDYRLTNAREPLAHAWNPLESEGYGQGSSIYYGHVILSDEYNIEEPDQEMTGAEAGVAASAWALQQAYNKVEKHLSNYSTTAELLGIMTSEIDLAVQRLLNTLY